jgi:SAM-dependent methyltransferase
MSVLDVGCGTGAITAGIAGAVGPRGRVAGIDRDQTLIDIARSDHSGQSNLCFEKADVLALAFTDTFDIVTAARTIQWVSNPETAIARMRRACRPGRRVIILDYNHARNTWEPDPPHLFRNFYKAFLDWREANGWDNNIADRLPEIFRACGLTDVETFMDDEVTTCGTRDFPGDTLIWAHVIDSLGTQLVSAGYISDEDRSEAGNSYRAFVQHGLKRQILCMRTVAGVRG